jgi:hypothetical protein
MSKTEVTGKNIKDSSVDLTVDVTGILPVANGGTGSTTIALNNVLLGNGTGAVQTVSPSTVGNLLVSNGTTWQASRTVNAPTGTDPLTIQNNGSTAWTFSQFGELFGAGGTGFYTDAHISAAAVASTGTLNLSSGVGKSSGSYDVIVTPYNNGVINLKSTTVQANSVPVVTTTGTQTLTGKTISGASNTLTNVPTSALSINGAATATVLTSENLTTTATWSDLTTTTDSVTVTVGASGIALVSIACQASNSGANAVYVGFVVSGANTIAAGNSNRWLRFQTTNSYQLSFGASFLLTGLSSGSTTIKMKYFNDAGTASFANRNIAVIPL